MLQCSSSCSIRVIRSPLGWLPPVLVGWRHVLLCCHHISSCWLSVVLDFPFCRAALFPSVLPSAFSFLFSFPSHLFLALSFLLQTVFVCRNAVCPRSHCGWHWMAKPPCCICNVYLRIVVCNHRPRLSMRHQHGKSLCCMYMGGNIINLM